MGSDIRAGQTVLAAGERIGPAEVGLLATVGAAEVQVRKKAAVPSLHSLRLHISHTHVEEMALVVDEGIGRAEEVVDCDFC